MVKNKNMAYILHKAAMAAKCTFTNKLSHFGVTPGQFSVLKVIQQSTKENSETGVSPAFIADQLQYDRPTISGIIDRLESQGWVERLPNPKDKRSFLIKNTEMAISHFSELDKICNENLSIITDGFTEEEKIAFKGYLLRVIDNFTGVECESKKNMK